VHAALISLTLPPTDGLRCLAGLVVREVSATGCHTECIITVILRLYQLLHCLFISQVNGPNMTDTQNSASGIVHYQ